MRQVDQIHAELNLTHLSLQQDTPSTADMLTRATRILDADYQKTNLADLCKDQQHLSTAEQTKLLTLLQRYEHLFDGTLGDWQGPEVGLELRPDAKPHHARPFPIPQIHDRAMRIEVERLVMLGVLEECHESEWAAPSFIIPKKNGTVRFISDFRKLNTQLRRMPFPIPKIQDMLLKLQGFQYASSLDLNMGYYTIRLNPDAQRVCTIILPWGKYKYKRLPMGIAGAPDIFQARMSSLMAGLEFVRTYLDDVLIINSTTFDDHLDKLDIALKRIADAGLKINGKKSFFARHEIEYLGYWVTRTGVQPLKQKVDAMLAMKEPATRKQLRAYIGLVNFYRDMWRQRSHVLAPLTALTSKNVPWKWTSQASLAFQESKKILSRQAMLAFPDFSQEFVIHTDASKYQLGGVISQNNRPLAFYSRKLNPAQTRYTTTERELLSIVETLKEFRPILLGQRLTVYTDHHNLIYHAPSSDRVLRWRLLIEEFGATIKYIKGASNIIADTLSRYPRTPTPTTLSSTDEMLLELSTSPSNTMFPVNLRVLERAQFTDKHLQQQTESNPLLTRITFRGGAQLICFKDRIYVPQALQKHVVQWYHTYLCHPGESRTEESIAQYLYWPNMRKTVRELVSKCSICQKTKRTRLKYGHLPPKVAEATPWVHLCVDSIGPYHLTRKGLPKLIFRAITMIDPATGWIEIRAVRTGRADEAANIIEQAWLTRYPWPEYITYDKGPEFKAEIITLIEEEYKLKAKPITARNPQANAILERVHSVIGDIIRTIDRADIDDSDPNPFDGIVSAIMCAVRSTYHTTLKATPGQLVFGRDMILPLQFHADWERIRLTKQKRINENNERENARRKEHDYAVNDKVLKLVPTRAKMDPPRDGPYIITRCHTNGTVTLRNEENTTLERINIRQIIPFKE